MKRNLAPIALFTYNRPVLTDKVIKALATNHLASQSELYIFSDGPKNENDQVQVEKVRDILGKSGGFKKVEIIKREENLGLAKSIRLGVTEVLSTCDRVIVLEDDLLTSSAFLDYMNFMLHAYSGKKKIFAITGFNFPSRIMEIYQNYPFDIYFSVRPSSWGWGTWRECWEKTDWDIDVYKILKRDKDQAKRFSSGGNDLMRQLRLKNKGIVDSWAIIWCYTLFKNRGLCVYPVYSYVQNLGFGDFASHTTGKNKYLHDSLNLKSEEYRLPLKLEVDPEILVQFKNVYQKKAIYKVYERFKEIIRK